MRSSRFTWLRSWLLALGAGLALTSFARLARADAPDGGVIVVGHAAGQDVIPTIDTTQAAGLIEQAFQAIHEGQWWVAAGLLVTLLVVGVHVASAKLPPRVNAFLQSPVGGLLLTTLLTAAGAVLHATAVGHPANLELLATVTGATPAATEGPGCT